jgi:hypothetical protein
MAFTAFNILIIVALILSIVGLFKPAWPIVAVAVLLVCAALLSKGAGA